MQAAIVSDLHLDITDTLDFVLPGGELLLIAGDLAESEFLAHSKKRLRKFREQLSKYSKVVAVMGNHEHYYGDINNTAEMYRNALPEVVLLENEYIHLTDNTILFGATLWTDMDKYDPLVALRAKEWSDYRRIRNGMNRLTPADTMEIHSKTVSNLYDCAGKNPDKEIVVLTHFSPSRRSTPEVYKDSTDNPYYHSSLEGVVIDNPNIKMWCHGHTHGSFDYTIEGCRFLCNPRGYQAEHYSEDTGFDATLTFEVK